MDDPASVDQRRLARSLRVRELAAGEGISTMEAARRVRAEELAVEAQQRQQEEERRIADLKTNDPRAWARMQAARVLATPGVRPEDMVPLLVLLYDRHLGGEVEGWAEWMPVQWRTIREIGQRLHELGGMALMLETHRLFAAERPRGGARNLEMTWDGIGDWRA